MRDFTAGHISSPEAAELMASAQEALGGESLEFRAGVSYRNLLVYRGATRHRSVHLRHPHDSAA